MKRLNFFAMKNDLLLLLSTMEVDESISYAGHGMLDSASPTIWNCARELPNLGEANGDQHFACEPYLIFNKHSFINVESQKMSNGILRFDLEQHNNPDSVVLIPGGEWKDGTLISGSITTISNSSFSQVLMRSAQSALRKYFAKVQAFWVGPEALIALRIGRRLAYAVQSPAEYDLREMPQ